MNVKVDIDSIGSTIDFLVEEELNKEGLPICFGNMVPPLLKCVVEFDVKEVLTPKRAVPKDEIEIEDISSLVDNIQELETEYVMTKENVDLIHQYKKERVKIHISQLVKCSKCELYVICNNLTSNYYKLISLEERI